VSSPDYLFVYGTLRRGNKNSYAELLSANSEFIAEARLAARVYELGPYRGAVLSHDPGAWISGEVFQLHETDSLFQTLDEYEGADYCRVKAEVELASGGRVYAWVYVCSETAQRRIAEG